MKITSAEFVKSATAPAHFPPEGLPEIAFAGKSNVGKSSLINSLVNRRGLAQTSSTPGRTRLINFFVVNKRFSFVDLPGYGYARVPEAMKKEWGPMIERYLLSRRTLRLVIVILDVRREPSSDDLALFEWLRYQGIPFLPVLTKADKVSKNELAAGERLLRKALGIKPGLQEEGRVLTFSAPKGEGRDRIWREIVRAAYPRESDPGESDPAVRKKSS